MARRYRRPGRHERLIAKQSQLFREIVTQHGPATDDSSKLQQGTTRSCLGGDFSRKGYNGTMRAPRSYDADYRATPTRVAERPFQVTIARPNDKGRLGWSVAPKHTDGVASRRVKILRMCRRAFAKHK